MQNLIVAAAQIPSLKGDVARNTKTHGDAIRRASENSVSLIVFPELSLTGYEPELAQDLAFSIDDERLRPLQKLAGQFNMYIVVGAPLKSDGLPKISAIVLSPDGNISSYSKINLHPGEEEYFQGGRDLKVVEICNHKIGIAVCADINNPMHIKEYAKLGVSVYVAGVLISEHGYTAETKKLADYAKRHNMLVSMANHNQLTGGWQPSGKSAAWCGKGGSAIAGIDKSSLVVSKFVKNQWVSKVVEL
ncbi:carbon-nitrogen hydrolase family protein [Microbulbifer variabilis]|uniref:carbon-nitrogen hydrolase family protein n=1 Tax=Microbulbifer variabilis TaxID=266805 RepID=UPI001CFCA9F9|nr:carbon-nitrogen hydrolase family protein [Microbulbifer variabilis]